MAFGSWLFAIVYLPLSRRDEVLQFMEDLWNRRSTIKAEATIPGDEQPGSAGGSIIAGAGNVIASVGKATGGYSMAKDFLMNMLNSLVMEKIFGKKRTT